MTAVKPKAYSYIRFSTPEQLKGDSLRRQTKLADDYCAKHGFVLDKELNLRDLGKSAWKGRNMDDTAKLGMFVRMLEDGDIPAGSVLLLEKLDRASRDYPLEAANTIARVIRAGCDVVTLDPEKRYNLQTIRGDIGALLTMIIAFAVANEESEKKSSRGKHAHTAKRDRKSAAGYGKTRDALTRIAPGWIRVTESGARELIPAAAKTVRRIFDMAAEGMGYTTIVKALNAKHVPTLGPSGRWHRSYIRKILRSTAAIGVMEPHTDDGTTRTPQAPIEDYYPAAVERELFDRVQAMNETMNKSRPPATSLKVRNVLAGLAKCPACGGTMVCKWAGTRKDGRPNGRTKLVCTAAKLGAGCKYVAVDLGAIEIALQRAAHSPLPEPDASVRDELVNRRGELEGIADAIENLVNEIEASPSKTLTARLTAREEQHERLSAELAALEKRASESETKVLKRRTARYRAAMTADPFDPAAANASLREMVTRVVVDYTRETLRMHWRHDGESEIPYGDEIAAMNKAAKEAAAAKAAKV